MLLWTVGYGWAEKGGGGQNRTAFAAYAKPTNKEKPFFSTAKSQLPTTPKLTCSHKFHPRDPTVSLQQNNPFSKLRSLALAVQLPFRTDSKPFRRRFVGKTGFGTCRRRFLQNHFRQSFESRSQDGVPRAFWLLFARCKK